MKLVLAILFGLFAFITIGVAGFVLIMPDDELAALVHPLPVIGPHSDSIVDIKHDVTDGASYFVDDTLYGLKSTWRGITNFSLMDQTQKVVIELEPVRAKRQATKTTRKKAPIAPTAPPPAPTIEPVAEPTKAPEHPEPATEPSKQTAYQQPEQEPVISVEKKYEPSKAEAAHTPKKAIENKKVVTAHPPKNPVTESKPIIKPPPIPKADTGTSEHKTGLTFYKGIGGASKNFKTAREWFLLAADKGNAASQYNLGIMAYLGQGTELSYEEAAIWFERAAKQDNTLAQYNLGFLFYEGKGVVKDDLQAFMWIDRAARLGDKKAIKARASLEKLLPKDLIEAR